MTPERWREVTQIYGAVVSQAPERRASAVAELCGADTELRREIESLLQSKDGASLLERAAVDRGSVIQVLSGGSQIGVFRIDSLLGVGGMGEVYRARDTKLNRDVAIKILPPAFANDPDRLARFKREAQVLASLNHPNVGGIYGFEDANGIHALVLELVDGPTLAERLQASGSGLPLEEALGIARQIADALEAAHEQGIIHRDLKPANIKVRDDGTIKVLDFGLAKLADPVGAALEGGPSLTQSPTITTPAMTAAGMILGTAAYMSPEQAKGKPADKRSDVWAFGCVLYEMLTGKRAFDSEDVSDTLANVLKSDPDWTSLPAETPFAVRRLLRRSLEKDRKRRLSDIADARLELEEREEPGRNTIATPKVRFRRAELVAWSTAAAMFVLAATTLGLWRPRVDQAAEMRVELNTPPTPRPESLAVSHDGRSVAFLGETDGLPQIWIRPLNADRAHPLAGTDQTTFMFWKPDDRSLGFFADGKLKRIDLDTGVVRTLALAPRAFGGTWNSSGTILFNAVAGPIQAVPADGGSARTILANDPQQLDTDRSVNALVSPGFRAPRFLPDGHHFLFYAVGVNRGVYVGDLNGDAPKKVTDADAAADYIKGYLLLVRQGLLFAQPFDADRLTLSGTPVVVAGENIPINGGNLAAIATTDAGTIVYRTGQLVARRQFKWVDRSGTIVGTVGDVDPFQPVNPELSRDGQRVVYNRTKDSNTDVWIQPMDHGSAFRFTTTAEVDQYPVWSPDGSSVVFSSTRGDGFHLYQKSTTGTAPETVLLNAPLRAKVATDWSPDGRFLLFRQLENKTAYDIWALPMAGDRKPFPVVQTEAEEKDGQFSPDGHWIAYDSDQSGRTEIYVVAFPQPGRTFGPVSAAGGTQVRWRADGKELFYISLDGRLMSVPITRLDAAAGAVEWKPAMPLFVARVPLAPPFRQEYMVAPDGNRFLMNMVTDQDAGYPITLILNWHGVQKP